MCEEKNSAQKSFSWKKLIDIAFKAKFKIMIAGLLLASGICLILIFRYHKSIADENKDLLALRETYITEPTTPPHTPAPAPTSDPTPEPQFPVPEIEIDFETLQDEVNADIYSWILIPDTPIDYPIVQHPEDNTFYLLHNLDGSSGYPGCIYTENYNSKDWDNVNTIIYGHNMKNGSMFAGLHEYEDETYYEEHPYIYIFSPDTIRIYEIFAAYKFSNLHLIAACDWNDPEAVNEFLSEIPDYPGIFNENADLKGDDTFLTLSTCCSGEDDKRFLVQAVLVAQNTN